MSHKNKLRETRDGTVINKTSSTEEKNVRIAMNRVINTLKEKYPNLLLKYESKLYLTEIVKKLCINNPTETFTETMDKTFISPDAGFLYAKINDEYKLILIGEVKNQGTNDIRLTEGKKKQAQGNAIERLGKNVIGIKAFLNGELCNPFVCFGDGCDFSETSTIIDRVKTINYFKPLNVININNGLLDNGSFFFRENKWSVDEMYDIMMEIALNSLKIFLGESNE